ncbi:GatB/YqeY domain-containing protein [Psychrosphaera sp. B3R10]|uniref:GatB/YqeY domain-containing protein n=1 Tax=Psychrosphaera algicola TaxID=3023714 RepID=A0ABT5FHR5_9GAMM|nr:MULTISPECIES: GatB/YqeY domain-containing protein [unclassified Psychrosphaera]MBU2880757.1 GatB/YqeY domain-containing protein [Psychrosphaera sp. I2R16]MBU2991497.1 GatB/YqeY domain-containing protein [Psychrosphaera sp. B3R10]MDC2890737.1 GatB/YqeY domain-containing protein [Psychrosphaera sp. G1-22]MDO6719389.1 GatB/YqeY domain-containing protein [Psychrosphaera sp. 1_MG-2023]
MSLIDQLKDAQKDAMRAKDKIRLGTIRMALAAVKQREVDERIELGDEDVIAILTKMVKQRKDSKAQYEAADRPELADIEAAEIAIIEDFLPQALTEEEVLTLLSAAIEATGASGMQDMGKVMAELKPKITGRADMGKVSGLVRSKLNS